MKQVTATVPASQTSALTPGVPPPAAYWGSVNGSRIISGSLSLPLYGAWVADVVLQTTTPLASSVSLVVGNLTLAGTVYRQAVFAGRLEARLVAGAGGWSKVVQARGYNNASGVLRSQVLSDVAKEVGETVKLASDGSTGTNYTRVADKASRVLRALAGSQWWIDSAGVTQVGPRPTSIVSSSFTVESFDCAAGKLMIATEDLASWLPGASFSSATVAQQIASSIKHVWGDDGIARLEVMVSVTNDRWLEDLREVVRQEVSAAIAYATEWEYVVTASNGSTIDALPVAQGVVPGLQGVPFRSGVPGGGAMLSPGTHVTIGFLDGSPGKAVVRGVFDGTPPSVASQTVSGTLTLGDQNAISVAKGPALAAVIAALGAMGASFQALTAPTILLPATWNTIGGTLIGAISPAITGPVVTTKVLAT